MKRTTEQIYNELLVLRCQNGETEAIKELISRWQMRLARFVFRQTGNSEDTADVMQEIWVSVIRKLKSLDDPAAFGGWIYRIARARTVDWIRKKKRERDLIRDTAEIVETSKQISSNRIGNNRQLELLGEALTRLPSEQHSILKMFYLEDRTLAEISASLNIPEGTVKSRLFRAREQLRELINRSIK